MNYTVTVYDSKNIVLETHWFSSHVEARVAKHKLAHGYHGKDVTGNSFVYPKDMDDRRY